MKHTFLSQNQDGAMPQYVSREALSRRWSISIDSVKRMERKGILMPYKLTGGRSVRYDMDQIRQLELHARCG